MGSPKEGERKEHCENKEAPALVTKVCAPRQSSQQEFVFSDLLPPIWFSYLCKILPYGCIIYNEQFSTAVYYFNISKL